MQIWLHAGSDFTSGSYTANTWSGQTNANRAVGISSLFSSTNNFFKITGVQLEVGSTATDFEHRSFAQELALCQRYCYVIKMNNANYSGFVGQAKTTDEAIVIGNAPVPMRDEPTYTGNNIDCQFNGADSSSIIQFDALSIYRVPAQRPVSVLGLRDADAGSLTAGQCILLFAKANGGRMTFDAEL
jgi:hypothetical protein